MSMLIVKRDLAPPRQRVPKVQAINGILTKP